jgi:hypothetical protein
MKKITNSLFSVLFAVLLLFSSACGKDQVEPDNPTAKNGVANATVIGPLTTAATLTRIQTNQKIVLDTDPVRGLAAGTYICDVYSSSASVTLTAGQFMAYDTNTGASKPGYTTPSGNTIGSSSSQIGNTYTFRTYSIVPLWDMWARPVNLGAFPRDLRGNVYTYSVFQP